MTKIRPMKGEHAVESRLKFPLYASPKIDGIRAIVMDGQFLSAQMKPIPNVKLQRLAINLPDGLDGELTYGSPFAADVYTKTFSSVMSIQGDVSDIRFNVFDLWHINYTEFVHRKFILKTMLRDKDANPHFNIVHKVSHKLISGHEELADYERVILSRSYEGVMLRSADGLYKFGQSTVNQGYLLKLKRYIDTEATVIGFEELERNDNPPTKSETGHQIRSQHKDNKIGLDMLGALVCASDAYDHTFKIGTGFTDEQRIEIWQNKVKYLNNLAKFKHFPKGAKDRPRHPVFLGWRSRID